MLNPYRDTLAIEVVDLKRFAGQVRAALDRLNGSCPEAVVVWPFRNSSGGLVWMSRHHRKYLLSGDPWRGWTEPCCLAAREVLKELVVVWPRLGWWKRHYLKHLLGGRRPNPQLDEIGVSWPLDERSRDRRAHRA